MADQCNPCLANKGAEFGAEGQVTLAQDSGITLAQAVGTGGFGFRLRQGRQGSR